MATYFFVAVGFLIFLEVWVWCWSTREDTQQTLRDTGVDVGSLLLVHTLLQLFFLLVALGWPFFLLACGLAAHSRPDPARKNSE